MKVFAIDTITGVTIVGAKNKIGAATIVAKDPFLRCVFVPAGENKLNIQETVKYITEIPHAFSEKSGIIFEYGNGAINLLK